MKNYFYLLMDTLLHSITNDEILLANLTGEDSTFIRFNQNRVRQAGTVEQKGLSLNLISGQQHASVTCDLFGELETDLAQLIPLLDTLRQQRKLLPDDPYLYYATTVNNSEHVHTSKLPDQSEIIDIVRTTAHDLDLVGIWASGIMYRGFANSLGQRNWHSTTNFNFDWSVFQTSDKAVKCNYAGMDWETAVLEEKINEARDYVDIMAKKAKTISPGKYRVFLAPAAVREIMDMTAWRGYGLKSHRTSHTPLIKMIKDGWTLSPQISVSENHERGLLPRFTPAGFIKPPQVSLIERGTYKNCLAGARSAKEYNTLVNSGSEHPSSLDLNPGELQKSNVLEQLDTGIYINNLWYCNFSDHDHCRITGMTRFACFWVENGEIQAPLNVMRFDDTVYNMLGNNLLGLTKERDFIFDASSYEKRSAASYHLPGALIDDVAFTL